MDSQFVPVGFRSTIIAIALVLPSVPLQVRAPAASLDPAKMPRIGTVEERIDFTLPTAGERYTLTAEQLEDTTVELNGKPLRLTSSGDLPQLSAQPVNAGGVSFAPISITFLTIANAGNPNCQ